MNLADVKKRTPLLAAAEHGHINTINLLLEKGANYLAFDSKGRSALHEAAQNGHELCTTLLCRSQMPYSTHLWCLLIPAAACARTSSTTAI